jgi:diaminopropionate ammonia-lyase family
MASTTALWYANPTARRWPAARSGSDAASFHSRLPGFEPTQLVDLPSLASELGVARVLVKDESSRLGLPAFKILGASWACARVVATHTGAASLDLESLRGAATGSGLRLVTATDGNHGRAVARMARLLGLEATVFVPSVLSAAAEQAIAGEGADVVRIDGDYDEAVRTAASYCDEGPGIGAGHTRRLVQDTAWPGNEVVPAWIVEGYDTLLSEIDAELGRQPDLVVVPVGVGSLAQAVVEHYRRPGSGAPSVLSVEPSSAACLLTSLQAGRPVTVETAATNMTGLNCGTVSSTAWPVLKSGCDAAICVDDADAARAVGELAALGVSSGPSGAATLAGVRAALAGPDAERRRADLGVDESAVVVLISTEGREPERSDEVVSLLEAMVSIDSSNPGLGPGAPGEAHLARFITDWASEAGLRTETLEGTQGRPSVLVRGGRAAGGRRLLLCGHLDTVSLAGMDRPLVPRIEGDRLYGRGAYDMKAGLAAALVACRDAARAGIDGEVLVAAVADEEHASLGVQEVLEHLGDAHTVDAAVVTEPTELAIGTAHRGFVWTEVEVTGKAAHGSRPHLGVDAILKTGPLLVGFADLDRRLSQHPHPFLGPGNLHASLISGGVEESTIPDLCTLVLERRTLPGETAESVEADVEEVLEACRAQDPGLSVRARTTMVREPFESPVDAAITEVIALAAERVTGRAAPAEPMSFWADSAFLAAAGIPHDPLRARR